MMKRSRLIVLCAALATAGSFGRLVQRHYGFSVSECTPVDRAPGLRPDYAGTVIPPNLAPLNFRVEEPGTHYRARFHSTRGDPITVLSRSSTIVIPAGAWKELLEANRGEELRCDIQVRRQDGRWLRFGTVTNVVGPENIDDYLVYRKIRPVYNFWNEVGIFQRRLSDYDESAILQLAQFPSDGAPCLNCHSFANNRPDRMTIAIRGGTPGSCTPIAVDGLVKRLDTKFGYTAWHPSGRLVAYSLNKVRQYFHPGGTEVRDVIDLESDLAYYDVGPQTVKTAAAISEPSRMETYPTWSPDGRYLYFCSTARPWPAGSDLIKPEVYEGVRYDLRRVRYDVDTDTWGDAETVLSSEETGLSILLPRVSPDGKFLLFCMCDYGCFPIYQPSSDLYLMNLEDRTYRRLEINSERSESWHSWSSNSRWFVFSSKRRDGVFTRAYLSYVDANGKAHKPLILPQKDPSFYDSHLKTYSVPEFLIEPVPVSAQKWAQAARSGDKIKVTLPDMTMTRGSAGKPAWRPFTERE